MPKKNPYLFRRALLGAWSVLCLVALKMSEPNSKVALRVGKVTSGWAGHPPPGTTTFWFLAKVEIPTSRLRVYEANAKAANFGQFVPVVENSLVPYYRKLSEESEKSKNHLSPKEHPVKNTQLHRRGSLLLALARSGKKFELPVFMSTPLTAKALDGRTRASLMALFEQKVITCLVVFWSWDH